jgi:hypothetical protein
MRRHRIVPIPQVIALVGGLVSAVSALVSEVLRNLRLFGKEVTGRVVGNLGKDAFRMTALAAQHPFRIGRHYVARMTFGQAVENKADTLSISRNGSSFHDERHTVFT